jgi:hypothetical protein
MVAPKIGSEFLEQLPRQKGSHRSGFRLGQRVSGRHRRCLSRYPKPLPSAVEKTKSMKSKLACAAVLTTILFLLTACTPSINRQLATGVPLSVKESRKEIPATVGVYYSPEFLSRQETVFGTDLLLGSASSNLFDQAVRLVFAKAISVKGRPPLADSAGVDAVIEPRIEAFDVRTSRDFVGGPLERVSRARGHSPDPIPDPYAAAIRYRFAFYDRTGQEVVSWIIIGTKILLVRRDTLSPWPGETVEGAIQDAMQKFVQGFSQLPEVISWVKRETGR